MPPLSQGDVIRYKTGSKWQPAVKQILQHPDSDWQYNQQKPTSSVEAPPELYHSAYDDDDEMVENPQDPPMSSSVGTHVRVSRYGRHIRLPVRYRDATQI